ncbi:MAG: hypothetical protein DRH06_00070 [Deltaproteobacteria bacterium]|nr:MAG: hypothetical protein DRH06_00070 [Deltaproteobacteria bacterium]
MNEAINAALTFTDSKEYFDATPEAQQAAKDHGFNTAFKSTDQYKAATPENQARMHTEYNQLIDNKALQSKHNPANQERALNEEKYANGTFLENTINIAKGSVEDSFNRASMLTGVVSGDLSPGMTDSLVAYDRTMMGKATTPRQKELYSDYATMEKEMDKSGPVGDTIAALKFAGNLITNPGGVIQVGAESASSLVAGWGGAKAGGAITAASGGALAPIGLPVAIAGSATAMAADQTTSKYYQDIKAAMAEQGLSFTKFNVNNFVKDNPQQVRDMQKDAIVYSSTIGLVDAALGGVVTKVAKFPTRVARFTALKELDTVGKKAIQQVANKSGRTVKEVEKTIVDASYGASKKNRTAGAKFKSGMGQYLAEVAGEPISEAAGTAAIGQEQSMEGLVFEAIGGVGAGPLGTAMNISAYGGNAATAKATKAIKDALNITPEQKQRAKTTKDNVKTAKKQAKAETQAKFNTQRDAADENTDVSTMIDPANQETFNPVLASEILLKSDTDGRLETLENLENTTIDDAQEALDAVVAFKESLVVTDGKVSAADAKEFGRLKEISDYKIEAVGKVQANVDLLKNKLAQSGDNVQTPAIDAETASEEEVVENITKTFGSNAKNSMQGDALDKAMSNPNISDDVKASLATLQKSNVAVANREAFLKTPEGKSIAEVSQDIMKGDTKGRFKGVNDYRRNINRALNEGNTDRVQSELAGLKKFADTAQRKAEVFQAKFDFESKPNMPMSSEMKAEYKKMQKSNPELNIHKGSGSLVDAVNYDAAVVTAASNSAEAYMALQNRSAKKAPAASTPAAPQSTPTATQTANEGQSTSEQRSSTEEAPVAPVVRDPEKIAKALGEAIQYAQKTGKTAQLQRAIDSGSLTTAQTKAAQSVINDEASKAAIEAAPRAAEPLQEREAVSQQEYSEELIAYLNTQGEPQSQVGTTYGPEGEPVGRVPSTNAPWVQEAIGMVGSFAKVENALKRYGTGAKLGKNQQAVVDLAIEQEQAAAEDAGYGAATIKTPTPATAESVSPRETPEVVAPPVNSAPAVQAVEAVPAIELDYSKETLGALEIEVEDADGNTEYVPFNELMTELQEEKNLYEDLITCLTSY